jgi:hypothetical protein
MGTAARDDDDRAGDDDGNESDSAYSYEDGRPAASRCGGYVAIAGNVPRRRTIALGRRV